MGFIKDKLKRWLLSEELNKLDNLQYYYNALYKETFECNSKLRDSERKLHNAFLELKEAHRVCDNLQIMLNEITDVGVDVGLYGEEHSWAVICIAGKPEYVKFIPLSHADARTVLDFLKNFRYSRTVIDSPFGFKDMVKREILRTPLKRG